MSRVIFLHGPAAGGKYTIGKELSELTGLALFHNHLVVDMLLAVFPFGSPAFVAHRERIWLDVIGDAAAAGTSLIFSFTPERTVSPGFPQALGGRVTAAGGTISFVEVKCDEAEVQRRIEAKGRQEFRKLNSLAAYRQLRAEGAFDYPPIPSELAVDSVRASPEESARQIAAGLGLPTIGWT